MLKNSSNVEYASYTKRYYNTSSSDKVRYNSIDKYATYSSYKIMIYKSFIKKLQNSRVKKSFIFAIKNKFKLKSSNCKYKYTVNKDKKEK